jgi:hypothetical protein
MNVERYIMERNKPQACLGSERDHLCITLSMFDFAKN